MDKVDFRREHPALYAPRSGEFSVVEVPPFDFLLVDGHGDPTSGEYSRAIDALSALSFAVQTENVRAGGRDYLVAPLEGLWHSEHRDPFPNRAADPWSWTLMIRQPPWITESMWDAARSRAERGRASMLPRVRFQRFEEGKSVQILHVGSYRDQTPTIERLHVEYLPLHGLVENGLHHEIYLDDPRTTEEAKLKTILRQPVRPIRPPLPPR